MLRFGIFVTFLVAPFASGCVADGCENAVLQDLPSPDGHRHAVVFTRSCGATTGVSTQVSVVPSVRDVHGGGNVFVADGGPAVGARWIDARTLEIRYHPAVRIFRRDARHGDTDIRYVAESASVSRP